MTILAYSLDGDTLVGILSRRRRQRPGSRMASRTRPDPSSKGNCRVRAAYRARPGNSPPWR